MLWNKLIGVSDTRSLVLVSIVTANDTTAITLPTVLDNDIAILIDSNVQTSTRAAVTPSGWTSLSSLEYSPPTGGIFNRVCVSYRLLTSSLSGTSVTGIDTSAGFVSKVLYVFRPSSIISSVSFGGAVGIAVGSANPFNPDPLTVVASGSNSVFTLVYGHHRGPTNTTTNANITMSPAATFTDDVGTSSRTNLLVAKGASPSVVIDMDYITTYAIFSGGYISLVFG